MCEAIVGRVIACNSFLLIPPNKRDKTLVFSEYMMLYGEHEAKERLSPWIQFQQCEPDESLLSVAGKEKKEKKTIRWHSWII